MFNPGQIRNKVTCPGLKHNGNLCTLTRNRCRRGNSLSRASRPINRNCCAVFVAMAFCRLYTRLQHVSLSVVLHASRWHYRHYAVPLYGGIGEHSAFYTGSDLLNPDPEDVYKPTFAAAFGMLYRNYPEADQGSATWRGAMVGHTISEGVEVHGKSALTYDFSNLDVDIVLSDIGAALQGGTYTGTDKIMWTNIPSHSDGRSSSQGMGTIRTSTIHIRYIDGDFGTEAQEVAGVFERDNLIGAFGGKRGPTNQSLDGGANARLHHDTPLVCGG